MIGVSSLYKRLFSSKFIFRSFFIKLLKIKEAEVRLTKTVELMASQTVEASSFRDQVVIAYQLRSKSVRIHLRRNTTDLQVFDQVMLHEGYKPLVDLVKSNFTGPVLAVVDAGANIGLASLYLTDYFGEATVYAIEPSPRNAAMLRQNMEGNNIRAYVFEEALLASEGYFQLQDGFRDKGDWSTRVAQTESPTGMRSVTLSEFRKTSGLSTIDILKMDIEGHEAELFDSDEFLKELKSVRFIALEVHEEMADRIAVINKLQALGFVLTYRGETLFGYNPAML